MIYKKLNRTRSIAAYIKNLFILNYIIVVALLFAIMAFESNQLCRKKKKKKKSERTKEGKKNNARVLICCLLSSTQYNNKEGEKYRVP